MENLTFDTLNAQWNQLRRATPNMAQIVMQRVEETPENLTVMFRGFDQIADPDATPQLLKRSVLQWIKRIAQVQIVPGDMTSFILRIAKPVSTPVPAKTPAQPAPPMREAHVHISKVRKVNGD